MSTVVKGTMMAIVLSLVALLLPQPVSAAGPITLEGAFTNADYRIRVPENWNGTLVVYAHGYAAEPPEAMAAPGGPDMEAYLLAQGYALAGSSFRGGGWAVKEGVQNTLALTNRFRGLVGNPKRIILWGVSMGSVVVLKGIETYPGIYDGAIAGCAVGAGTPLASDATLAFSLAYDVALGWPAAWGGLGISRPGINFAADVLPVAVGQLSNPADFGKFEFVRLVNDLPADQFYSGPGNWLFGNLYYATAAAAELSGRAGGLVAQNQGHAYSLNADEKAYLAGLGVDANALLAAMNARSTYAADRPARNYVSRNAAYTGDLKRPVLTLHTTTDGIVAPWQEGIYQATVAAAGKQDLLLQVYTGATGHCAFTGPQLAIALAAMDQWLTTGVRPDSAFFPVAAGFVPAYTAPAWPYGSVAPAAQEAEGASPAVFLPLTAR